MIHYHGTPVTPRERLYELAGRHFCVSFAEPRDVKVCHEIGQSVMLDNGAFTLWTRFQPMTAATKRAFAWDGFYDWADPWLDFPTTWAVIPDVIDGDEEANDRLLVEWWQRRLPKGAPVWHMHESIDRLLRLAHGHERICFGSSGSFSQPGDDAWRRRVSVAFDELAKRHDRLPWIHMLRGMALSGDIYPFASVDSTDIARNHSQRNWTVKQRADYWDSQQTPARWVPRGTQLEVAS